MTSNGTRFDLDEVGQANHGYGHRLWAGGERTIARECFRLAAMCEVPEAETDTLLLDATGGKHVFDCDEFSFGENDFSFEQNDRDECAPRSITSGARHSRLKMAACVLGAVAVTAPTSGWFVSRAGTEWETPVPAAASTHQVIARQAMLPTIDAILSPLPSAARPAASPPLHLRSHSPQLEVDQAAPIDAKYAGTLSSGAGEKLCNWQIVGSASDRPSGITGIQLKPGEVQEVNVSAEEWPNLAVFAEPAAGGGASAGAAAGQCKVAGWRVVPAENTPTPGPAPTPTPTAAASPTPSATPATSGEPPPVEAMIAPPAEPSTSPPSAAPMSPAPS
jgi:hypothetical protein